MAYQFTQTGAEIQDILDQVPVNTGNISQNTQDISELNSGFAENVSTSLNVASGSWTSALTITLQSGLYLINYGCAFAANSSGYRGISFSTSGSSGAGRRSPLIGAAPSDQTRMTGARLVTASGGTYSLWVNQNSGSTLTCYPWIEYVKLR